MLHSVCRFDWCCRTGLKGPVHFIYGGPRLHFMRLLYPSSLPIVKPPQKAGEPGMRTGEGETPGACLRPFPSAAVVLV